MQQQAIDALAPERVEGFGDGGVDGVAHVVAAGAGGQIGKRTEFGDRAHRESVERLAQPFLAVAIGARGIELGDARVGGLTHQLHRGAVRRLASHVGHAIGKTQLHGAKHQLGRTFAHERHPIPVGKRCQLMVKETLTDPALLKRIGRKTRPRRTFFLRFRHDPMGDRHFDIAPQQRTRRIGNITPPQ